MLIYTLCMHTSNTELSHVRCIAETHADDLCSVLRICHMVACHAQGCTDMSIKHMLYAMDNKYSVNAQF